MKLLDIKQISAKTGKYFVLNNDTGVSRALSSTRQYQPTILKACLAEISQGDVVLDLGANLGTFTVPFAKAVRSGTVHAFEPQRVIFQLLCANVFINGLPNVWTHNVGLSDSNRSSKIKTKYRADYTYFDKMPFSQCTVSDEVGEAIELRTLDSYGFEKIDLIKIDVELHELQCIQGAMETLEKCRPVIVMELPERRPDQITIAKQVRELLIGLGYNIEPIVRKSGDWRDILARPSCT